ncbi:N-acetylglucosamine kinase 1 [Elasticomyces elasticus]|uniref:Phosphotransferase n=1 Tax=Exophiala sideris TaxID=1016849 RepID=A0ABR0J708_9EURO|nr:N-acetylglucosamine kinase 1 [Elasticomyces elasticus]KAK5028922.1 N-acetylglucosamine kinase 1 [Exophiala sideris]KAK5035791.1 N-acetylglucosamine kinase 1 [Exophiala sideris]KAK5057426.1 N-acetylglucosamine kinase 1 [Exophiala sideris]KAK5181598.1 N-acetylglucosamine kinase 1 [Eurotiomycetes sp. CCFEE 6388]
MTILDFLRRVLRHLAALLLFRSSLKTTSVSPKSSNKEFTVVETDENIRTLTSLKDEIMRLFRQPCNIRRMLSMSSALRIQYKAKLQDNVGGSTFRVAIVALSGREGRPSPMYIEHMSTFKIDERIRRLPSKEFFDWMASSIQATLETQSRDWPADQPLPMGLAWSFPIEQTSHRSGKMQNMGKGFACHQDTIGMDLGTLIEAACAKRQLNVRVNAIVNDSSATLLSQAYLDPATSMGLILGTGTNAAVYLPTSCMGLSKFGTRDQSWFESAGKVITNTELSMFGKSILPQTRWDETLNREHQRPDFQPLEYMTTGRYLGELLRLIIVEAVETRDLFDGNMPLGLTEPYSLDTQTLARLEQDNSSGMSHSISMIQTTFGLKMAPSVEEVAFLRAAAEAISYRASAYMAVAVHALWALQKDVDINLFTSTGSPKTSIACNGSVILKYPDFKSRCEDFLRRLVKEGLAARSSSTSESIVLETTEEAAIYGAAIAVALSETP